MLNPNPSSLSQPEVEIRPFLRVRSGKNGNNRPKIAFFGQKLDLCGFSGMLNPNASSFSKPEVEIMAFLRMHSGKRRK